MMEFRIDKEVFKKSRNRWIAPAIPLVAITAVLIVEFNILKDTGLFLYIAPLFVAYAVFSIYRTFRKQKQFLQDYRIVVSDSEILREQSRTLPLTISFMEIKQITKTEKGNFIIKGRTRGDTIYIPHYIGNADELEKRLNAFLPVTVNEKDPFFQKYRLLVVILPIAAVITIFNVSNPIILGSCGLLLTGFAIWLIYEIRISKNVPEKAKRMSWVFLLCIAAFLYFIYEKITGGTSPF